MTTAVRPGQPTRLTVGVRARHGTLLGAILVVLLAIAGCGSAVDQPGSAAGAGADPLSFSGETTGGQTFDAAALDGTPVVLWFWAPWCTVCRAEAPDVAAVASALKGDVTFVGIAGRGEVAQMQTFITDTGTGGFQHLADLDGSLWQRFQVAAQPAFVFVGADGSQRLYAGSMSADQLRTAADGLIAG